MKIKILFLSFFFIAAVAACDDTQKEKATLNVSLTDNPLNVEEVNVDIQSLSAHIIQGTDRGWYDLNLGSAAGVYNLLDLVDTSVVISSGTQVPNGTLRELRLILGQNNTIVTVDTTTNDTTTHDLKVPSGQQSGIKIKVMEPLAGPQTYNILLDFDAEKSVVEQGNGSFLLKPVIFIEDFSY